MPQYGQRSDPSVLPALGVFLFTPAENALCQRVDVGRGNVLARSLPHERIDRCLRVLPGETGVLGGSDEHGDCLAQPRRRANRVDGSRESAREALLADANEVGLPIKIT